MKKILFIYLVLFPVSAFCQNVQNVLTRSGQAQQCFWDDTNNRLGIETATPISAIHLNGGLGAISYGICWNDGDTCLLEATDDVMYWYLAGASRWSIEAATFGSITTSAAQLLQSASSATVPSFRFRGDSDTGVGRANADQLSLIAGGVEVARAVENTYDQFIISPDGIQNDATTPSFAFGDGDSGLFETADDEIRLTTSGVSRAHFDSAWIIRGVAVNQPGVSNVNSTTTTAGFLPRRGDTDTGVGGDDDILSLIAGGVEGARLTEGGTYDQFIVSPDGVQDLAATPSLAFGDGDSGFYENADDALKVSFGGVAYWRFAAGQIRGDTNGTVAIVNEVTTPTNPTLVPANTDLDTGVGGNEADALSLIAGGVEGISITEDTNKLVTSIKGAVEYNITTVAAATYDTLETDHILHVTYTGTGAVTSLTLMSASCTDGRILTIKDAAGNAAANSITIDTEGAETIDGAATAVINGNYDSIDIYCYSSNWFIK